MVVAVGVVATARAGGIVWAGGNPSLPELFSLQGAYLVADSGPSTWEMSVRRAEGRQGREARFEEHFYSL